MTLKLVKDDGENRNSSKNIQILNGLNPPQKEAVQHINGPLLIIAGAGSGKTRVLTHRVAYLIQQGIKPWNILALTFTNKAANEMVERIAQIVDEKAAKQIWAGTFHSIFARILRTEAEQIGYTSNFSIYDADDSLRLIRNVMDSLGISQKEFPAQGMRSRISNAKNQMLSVGKYRKEAEETGTILEQQTGLVFETYEKQLKLNNAMDFDDLLINIIHVLQNSKETLQKYQDKFKYILVDEYQDTNRAQYLAVNLLAKSHKNLCVVGDDAQSIYRWRGADIRNILDFQKDFPDAKVIRLEQNYRSTKLILDAADSVIRNNRNQMPKKLWTEQTAGDKIKLFECGDERHEAEKIGSGIRTQIEDGCKPEDIAVLYRTNAQSLAIENALRMMRIPYMIVGGTSFYRRKEIKDALSYLRLLLNRQDNESLLRIVNEPPRGLGKVSLNHIKNYAEEKGLTLFEAFLQADKIDELKPKAKNSAKQFAAMLKEYLDKDEKAAPDELARKFIEAAGLPDMYKEIGTEEALDRWNNIDQLLSDITQYFRGNDEDELEDYLQQVSLVSDIDEADTSENKVKLMTLHSAKGLEFPVVFISGLEQGLFPLQKSDMHPEEEAEERRLFYVGITRAERRVFLSYARRRMRFGEIQYQSPSDFINEIDEKYIESKKKKTNAAVTNTQSSKSEVLPKQYKKNHQPKPEPQWDFEVGDRVSHSHFGVGKITGLSGSGEKRMAIVSFPNYGKKKLMLQYAKLVKI